MTAAEHFDWAVQRALEYATTGDCIDAMGSLVSDLGKHPGTRGILHGDQLVQLIEVALSGSATATCQFMVELSVPGK